MPFWKHAFLFFTQRHEPVNCRLTLATAFRRPVHLVGTANANTSVSSVISLGFKWFQYVQFLGFPRMLCNLCNLCNLCTLWSLCNLQSPWGDGYDGYDTNTFSILQHPWLTPWLTGSSRLCPSESIRSQKPSWVDALWSQVTRTQTIRVQ